MSDEVTRLRRQIAILNSALEIRDNVSRDREHKEALARLAVREADEAAASKRRAMLATNAILAECGLPPMGEVLPTTGDDEAFSKSPLGAALAEVLMGKR